MNTKHLLPVTKNDKLIQVIFRRTIHYDAHTRYYTSLIVQPENCTTLKRAFQHFIEEDGKPGLRVCLTQPCGTCRGAIDKNIENCRYIEQNMYKKVGFFYRNIPADITKEELEKIEKANNELVESKRRINVYLD